MRPAISVITPCLNPGIRLERCLVSVAMQEGVKVEHIVVDGGSDDGTVELLASRPDVSWVSEPDSGQSEALNKGLAMATGEIIGWLNADDMLLTGALEHVVHALHHRADAGWVYGDVLVTGGDRPFLRRGPRHLTRDVFDRENPIPQPGSFVRDWAFERVGGLDPQMHLAMDVDLWLRLFQAGVSSIYLPRPLAVFEIHEASKTGATQLAPWLAEEALARRRIGWDESAAFYAGRAAGRDAATEADTELDVRRAVTARLLEIGLGTEGALAELALGAAWLEAATVEAPLGTQLARLLRPSVWRHAMIRRDITARIARAARRAVGGRL